MGRGPRLKRSHTATSFEPFTLLSALAMVTERLGLIATGSTTFDAPYHVARRFDPVAAVQQHQPRRCDLERQPDQREEEQQRREDRERDRLPHVDRREQQDDREPDVEREQQVEQQRRQRHDHHDHDRQDGAGREQM